jgi:hypothetical protein
MIVDWYAFWLLGDEDSQPDKQAQYRRWRELRLLQCADNARKLFCEVATQPGAGS